ncbi:hypothetical protein [Bradyrhizobium erythrophlei]|nr:hypothetical protein [Bradyrhizobium erythrophlei]
MPQIDGYIEQIVELLGDARSEMVTQLASSMAIVRDSRLREGLREIATVDLDQEFLISQLNNQSWLKVGGNGHALDRKRQPGLSAISLDEVLRTRPAFEQLMQDSMRQTNAMRDAYDTLDPLFQPSPMQSRSNFLEIFEWAPLLEQIAYKSAMRVLQVLDLLRSAVRIELSAGMGGAPASLQLYWQLIHALGQLTLVASSEEARPWLSEMANSFVWERWTPSFALLRERTFWLAAIAARSAAAFGEPVVESYLKQFAQAEHPMMVFDALFGLSAIALANPSSKDAILAELRKLRDHSVALNRNHSVYLICFESAVRVLSKVRGEQREFRELHWHAGSANGMATRAALVGDPTALSASGEYLGFSMLQFVADSPHDEHFPRFPVRSAKEISRGKIAVAFRRAWIAEPEPPTRALLN